MRIKEREVNETLLESKLSRAFNAWRSKGTLICSSYFLWYRVKSLLLGSDVMNQLRREAKLLRMDIFALALAVAAGK